MPEEPIASPYAPPVPTNVEPRARLPLVNLICFGLTVGTTLLAGGIPYSLTVMSILLAHEMGHYVTARYYGVRATLPFFVPFPSIFGTLGALIILRSPFPNRRVLLDIGLAGPYAGLIVALPALVIGIAQSRPGPLSASGLVLGDPLLFQWVTHLVWPEMTREQILYASPVAMGAWFGLLATALNLMPIGQLDGGHASYALFGKGAHRISQVAFLPLLVLAISSPTWVVWAIVAYVLGVRRGHPPTLNDAEPLPRSRKVAGVLGYVAFVLCFTPFPFLFTWTDVFHGLVQLIHGLLGR